MMADVGSAILEGRHVIANAPTGIGKTAAVLAPAVRSTASEGRRVLFLTSKQSHHRIAIETLRAIRERSGIPLTVADIIGKQSMCPRPEARLPGPVFARFCARAASSGRCAFHRNDPAPTVSRIAPMALHVHELVEEAVGAGLCPHRTALLLGASADVVICDYNYAFSDLSAVVLPAMAVDPGSVTLVVDEAHNLPGRIIDGMSTSLTELTVLEALHHLRTRPQYMRPLEALRGWLAEVIGSTSPGGEALLEIEGPAEAMSSALRERLDGPSDVGGFLAELQELPLPTDATLAIDRTLRFLGLWREERPGMVRYVTRRDGDRAVVELMDPSEVAGPVLQATRCAILMSGTMHPQAMYSEVLGMPRDRTDARDYPSPFPPSNTLVMSVTGLTTRYVDRGEEMYGRYGRSLSAIARSVPGSMAVYFPSYDLMDAIARTLDESVRSSTAAEMPGMSKEEREGLFEDILSAERQRVLLGVAGGPLAEGMDFSGNALKAVVIVGLPLPPRTIAIEAKERYFEGRFGEGKGRLYAYLLPALNRVVQAAGRMIRSESDRGAVLLLDDRYRFPMYRGRFPPGFSYSTVDDPVPALDRFFGNRAVPGVHGMARTAGQASDDSSPRTR